MALLPIPDDFGQGGANIGDGEIRLVDILKNHHEEIAAVEAGSVDNTARAAAAAAQSAADGAATAAAAAASAAATAQSTADGAVTVNGTQDTAIAAAASDAATALSEANGATVAAAAAQSAANGASVAAATAQTTADSALANAPAPLFGPDVVKARARSLVPFNANARFYFTDDPYQDGLGLYQNAHGGSPGDLSSIRLDDNSSTTPNNVYSKSPAFAARSGKWYMYADVVFEGTATGSTQWRALVGTDHQDTFSNNFGTGLFADIATGVFSFRTHGDNPEVTALSTIAYSPGRHTLEMWYDGTALFGSVDGETAVQISTSGADRPDGPMAVVVTNKDSTQETKVDAISWMADRTAL